jgi:hypothetical protein
MLHRTAGAFVVAGVALAAPALKAHHRDARLGKE